MPTPFGQNFLIDEKIATDIVEAAKLTPRDKVLEIGPGKGILTQHLIKQCQEVLAIEIDNGLAVSLKKRLRDAKNLAIITGDAQKINLPEIIEDHHFEPSYKLVANLPYYLTSHLIRIFLETKFPPREMILMVQKEVGERIIAQDGKESLLSVSVKFYAEPKILFYVARENFDPAPMVDSVVIRIKRKNALPPIDPKAFFSVVRAGFSAKRKVLANNLASSFQFSKIEAIQLMNKAGVDPAIRAEKLDLSDWIRLQAELSRTSSNPTGN